MSSEDDRARDLSSLSGPAGRHHDFAGVLF